MFLLKPHLDGGQQHGFTFARYFLLHRLLQLDPRDGVAYSNRGYAYRKLGDFEAAANDYKMAIKLSPASVRLHNNRAYCFAKLGKYKVSCCAVFAQH